MNDDAPELDLSKMTAIKLQKQAKPFVPGNVIMYEAARKELFSRGYDFVGDRWIIPHAKEEEVPSEV